MAYDNAALVRRYFDEVWTKGNLAVADELIAVGGVSYDPIAGELKGSESIKGQVREYRSAFPDLRVVIDDLVVAGDKAVARWTATGTHKGTMMGVAPTGKTFIIEGISCERISNGKIVEHRAQWDTLKFLQNLGLVPLLSKGAVRQPEARPH